VLCFCTCVYILLSTKFGPAAMVCLHGARNIFLPRRFLAITNDDETIRVLMEGNGSNLILLLFMPFPFFAIQLFTVPFGRPFFNSNSFFAYPSSFRWCDGAPGHFPRPPTPIPPHIHRHTQHLYTHGRLFPTGLEPVLTSRWWSKEC
jgi:hypothetical protein